MIRSLVIATIFIATCALSTGAEAKKHPKTATHAAYANRADAMEFANDLAARRDLDPAWVRQSIGQARCAA